MARPTKQGIDYFPLDVQFDDDAELFLAEHGAEGLGILVTIWQIIYKDKGYYTTNNDDLILLIRRRCMAEIPIIKNVISSLISRGIFSKHKHNKHKILTSKGIQERYFIASKKKKTINVDGNYICKGVSVGLNAVDSSQNATKEEEEVKEEVDIETGGVSDCEHVFNFWNSKKIITHKTIKQFEGNIQAKLTDGYSKEELTDAIQNYSIVLFQDKYYWTHKYGLKEFLTRAGNLDRFLSMNKPFDTFINNDDKKSFKAPVYQDIILG